MKGLRLRINLKHATDRPKFLHNDFNPVAKLIKTESVDSFANIRITRYYYFDIVSRSAQSLIMSQKRHHARYTTSILMKVV